MRLPDPDRHMGASQSTRHYSNKQRLKDSNGDRCGAKDERIWESKEIPGLKGELGEDMENKIVPVIVRALGIVTPKLGEWL